MSIHTFLLSAVMLFVSASTAMASVPDTVQVETRDTIVVCEDNIDSAFSVGPCCPKIFHKNHRGNKGKHRIFGSVGVYGGFLQPLGAPQWMHTDMAASNEIGFELEVCRWYNRTRKQHFSFGVDLDWRNYRAKGRQRFVQDEAGNLVMSVYPTEASRTYSSRIKTFSVGIPLRYTFILPKHWRADVAAVVRFNTFATAESYYDVPDAALQVKHHVKESYSHLHQQPVSVDLKARIHWRWLGVYVSYSPCKVLNADYGPKFSPLSVGASFSL